MKTFCALVLLSMVSASAQAAFIEGWERPLYTAKMKTQNTQHGFQGVHEAILTLTRKDGSSQATATGMALKYRILPSGQTKDIALEITQTEVDQCGSTHYFAQLPRLEANPIGIAPLEREPYQARFSIQLVDHSTRTCEDYHPYLWEAEVRAGYGFCGTFDATMQMKGNPEPVVTMQ